MDGTCIETPPQVVPGMDAPYVFTFHPDIANFPKIVDMSNQILARGKDILTKMQRYFLRWVKHKPIWVPDKVSTIEWFPIIIFLRNQRKFYIQIINNVILVSYNCVLLTTGLLYKNEMTSLIIATLVCVEDKKRCTALQLNAE